MRYCAWCGEPLEENAPRHGKYHKGRCAGAAGAFHSYLRNKSSGRMYDHEDFSTHERMYRRFLERIYDTPGYKPIVFSLGIEEWWYMADLVIAAEECDIPSTMREGPRIRELAEIANTILEMPCTAVYRELPQETRDLIMRYLGHQLPYWYSHPQETIRRRSNGNTV